MNFREDIVDLKQKMNVEQVWIDFGKQHTKVKSYDPEIAVEGDAGEIDFNGHQIYFIMPPHGELLPSNVMVFELVFLSSKERSDDVVMGWGAFPIVNGDFQLNKGKFKVPLIHGEVDYTVDAFKCIESKYKQNLDEWLCNLYIEIKPIILNDFKEYESKVCFTT